MTGERTRSEYRLAVSPEQFDKTAAGAVLLSDGHRDGLARLMLDAYRGTIDDEGETLSEAYEAVDHFLEHCLRDHSFVLEEANLPIAMSLVVTVDELHYIDPVVVGATHKGRGVGRRMVETSLGSLARTGVTEVGAAITDGNEPSERLFASLGATRVGPWPPIGS